jgi:hypothetical protein
VVSADAMASVHCRRIGTRAKVESDPFGTDLAYMYVSKRYCYNGHRLTRVSRRPRVYPVITDAGNASNWEWDGVFYQRHRYYTKNGHRRGGHFTWVQGKFHQTIFGYTKVANVWVKLWAYYNGAARSQRDNS